MNNSLVIGSRGSKLALTQAGIVKAQLELLDRALTVRIEIVKTSGDVKSEPLSVIGGKAFSRRSWKMRCSRDTSIWQFIR